MQTLKKNFISLQVHRALRKPGTQRGSVSYSQANEVGILFSAGDMYKHDQVKKLVKLLENDGKRVEVLSFLDKNQDNHEFKFDFFREEDVNFWGQFISEMVERFINKPFDYLFHLDLEPNQHIEHVLAKSRAKCRIGAFHDKKSSFYEMMVKPEQSSINELINQLYHYTRSLI